MDREKHHWHTLSFQPKERDPSTLAMEHIEMLYTRAKDKWTSADWEHEYRHVSPFVSGHIVMSGSPCRRQANCLTCHDARRDARIAQDIAYRVMRLLRSDGGYDPTIANLRDKVRQVYKLGAQYTTETPWAPWCNAVTAMLDGVP